MKRGIYRIPSVRAAMREAGRQITAEVLHEEAELLEFV